MKKILFITENIGSGGAERQLCGLASFLTNRGYHCRLITYLENQFYEDFLRKNNVDYYLIKNGINIIKRFYYVNKEIRRFEPDTVISFLSAPNKLMCLLKLVNNYDLIVSERNTTMHWGKQERITFNLYRLANYIVPNSTTEGENIIGHNPFLKGKVVTITNFVDTEHFRPKHHLQNKIPVILCVGRITEQKNALRFVEAVKILKDRGLLFFVKWFGNYFYADYRDKVFAKVIECNLSDVINFHEPIDNIVEEYQQADFFCLPSIYEGYPNVLCEAMSCGLPVVCSNTCENPKIVSENIHGFLFDPYSVDSIVSSIEKMLKCSNIERENMGIACRKSIVDNNSIAAFTNKYISLL